MKIYLLRHGESVAAGDDDKRPLTPKGKEDIQFLAHFLQPLHLHMSQVFYSEKQRAKETAQLLAHALVLDRPMQARSELGPLSSVDTLIDEVPHWPGDTLLVGHMPFMGTMLSQLVTHNDNFDVGIFKTGTLVCLQKLEDQRWAIEWMLTPGLFV